MDAKTAVKARLLDLTTSVLELVRDGNRDAEEVCSVFQGIKDNPNFLGQFFAPPNQAVYGSLQLEGWQTFYHQFFNLELDFSGVRIPERRVRFDRLIIVAQGITPNQVYDVCAQRFPCWRCTEDLDKATKGLHERDPKDGHYAIWVRDRIEADEELKNLSANQIKEAGLTTETLTERLLHELKFWSETGRHLDIQNITLCSGSRPRGGPVPHARWYGGKFRVYWARPDDCHDDLRARGAVS